MKQIRRSLKNERHQSPPSSGGSQQSGKSFGQAPQANHHVLSNGMGGLGAGAAGAQAGGAGLALAATLPPSRQPGRTPPTKVIRAVAGYRSKGPPELSFETGDFFHVLGDGKPRGAAGQDQGELWYDASNPLTKARGIVPASYFQVLGRSEKDPKSASAGASEAGTLSPPPQQGLGLRQQQQHGALQQSSSLPSVASGVNGSGISPSPSPLSATFPQHRASGSSQQQAKPRTRLPPLYGVVQHDFVAERADELDGKRGEPLIVIAQSNHEWFVAKPIGRLGGPGLIPVSFVAISDTTTGEALPEEKVREMIASGMVPPVEEWKKATAEYKQSSIPLGRFEFSNQSTPVAPAAGPSQPYQGGNASANASSSSFGQYSQSHRPPSGSSAPSAGRTFSPNASTSSLQQSQYSSHQQAPISNSNSNYGLAQSSSNSFAQQQHPSSSQINLANGAEHTDHQQPEPVSPTGYVHVTTSRLEDLDEKEAYEKYGIITHATVESFHNEEDNYWFHLRVRFDETGYSLILYRLYDDFHEFQIVLKEDHPVEAGDELPSNAQPGDRPKRIIPKMPGPVANEDEHVCAERVQDLTTYLAGLCQLPEYLRMHLLFYEFFLPRPGDVEVTQPRPKRSAAAQQRGIDDEVVEYLDKMGNVTDAMNRTNLDSSQPAGSGKPQLAPLSTSQSGTSSFAPGYSMSGASASNHARQPSDNTSLPSAGPSSGYPYRSEHGGAAPQSAGSGIQFSSPWAQNNAHAPASTAALQSSTPAAAPPPFVKIKIFHRNTDDLIAIRVPPSIRLDALLDKVRERLGGDVSHVRYRDEGDRPISQSQAAGAVALPGGGRLVELRTDAELDSWIVGAQRLVAYVD